MGQRLQGTLARVPPQHAGRVSRHVARARVQQHHTRSGGKGCLAEQTSSVHLLGTCRMGNDPATSVVDRYHRSHDVPNLFVCDGSSLVTSGRGQPTMTIQALAFRADEHITRFAKRGEI